MKKNSLSTISEIIKDGKKGKMFILVDDKDRENEGDLVIPASKCNSRNINFMATHGRGLICLTLTKHQVNKLGLPLMSAVNKARMQTAFTVSIEAKKGITTGISAFDRARTIKTAINKKSKKSDIVSPGHVFPLVSRDGGVLERAGHTEASVDISILARLNPSSVICEVMNEDGRMARLDDLIKFSQKHKIKIASISDLISFRLKNEKLITLFDTKALNNNKYKNLEIKKYRDKLHNTFNYVIKKGIFNKNKTIRVRVLSTSIIKDKLDLNNKLISKTLNYLNRFNYFVLIIIKDQKTLKQKISEQTKGNNILRYYGIGAQIIKDLGIKNMILVSRSKKKIIGLDGYGIKIISQEILK
jgi:3,4-dihydroxy 2-butanone 4-phosphate synthase / GTP cyclohydrolase II